MTIPPSTIQVIHGLKHIIAERARTTRRFIKSTKPPYAISDLNIIEIDNDNIDYLQTLDTWFNLDIPIGLISESGMPSVADPGSLVVKKAHEKNIPVSPLVGPSSILLALAASGLNGQSFTFHGYLPIKSNDLKKKIGFIESQALKYNQTQIFIETPYRNDRMLDSLKDCLSPITRLCIARDITGPNEMIVCKPISKYRADRKLKIGKEPCIFIIGK